MDILTSLGLYYRVASLKILFFVVPGINIPKIRSNGHSGNDYRVATLSKSYLTTTGITMQSLKSIGQF